MTSTSSFPSATLYYRQGGSDKVYQAAIEPAGEGFVVTFAFGRRGLTLQTGVKTASPVALARAQAIFDKLVGEKLAKGYSPGVDGTPYQQTSNAERATGIFPQLLNPVDEAQAALLLEDPVWLTQEKLDGQRGAVSRDGQRVIGINRKGLEIALPQPVVDCALSLNVTRWLIDGECIGDTFHAFDLLEQDGTDLRPQPCRTRLDLLYLMPILGDDQPIRFVRTAVGSADKRAMLARLREQSREGIVFKRTDAPYIPGRPASGGDQLKLKFTATASCIVAAVNAGRRSVRLELLDGDQPVAVGNVTIPPGRSVPDPGTIVEVRYLYAYRGGALFQPVYLGTRDDIATHACTVGQLKFKTGELDE